MIDSEGEEEYQLIQTANQSLTIRSSALHITGPYLKNLWIQKTFQVLGSHKMSAWQNIPG